MTAAAITRVGVAILIEDGRVLIDRRASGPLAGWWEFPGGKAEPHEAIADCIVRECLEELGIHVAVEGQPLRVLRHEYPHAHVELHFHLCRRTAGIPRPLQVAELAWVRPSQTRQYPFLAANAPIIDDLITRFEPPSSEPAPSIPGPK